MVFSNMLSLETLGSQISVVMETVAEAAVTELRRLLDLSSANVKNAAEGKRSSPATLTVTLTGVKSEKQESRVTPAEHRQQLHNTITTQFTSLMAARTKEAVEKILMLLKVSLCEAENGLNDKAKQSKEPKAVTRSKKQLRGSCFNRKRSLKPAPPESDHIYHRGAQNPGVSKEAADSQSVIRPGQQQPEVSTEAADSESVTEPADAATEESDSGSLSEAGAFLIKPSSVLEPRADDVQGETQALSNTSKNKKSTGPFRCPSCDKTFTLKCLMERHCLTHSKPHLCSECGKRFSVLRGLHAHSRRHTGEKLHKCLECGTEFAHKSTYDRHMRRHSLNRPNTHTCPLCENKFTGALALQRHRCSALKKTFICSLCPETFQCRQSLADHENLHTGSRDFVCEMCGDSFLSSSSLATHRVTHIQKKICCDMLGVGCSDLSVLRNHLSKHSGEKLFTCEVCGKGCSHRSALKHHMLTHTGERLFVCETCGKRCSHASALQNHTRIHTGRKPGQQPACDICGKKFSRMVNLKYHMSVHTGVKPYTCDQCNKKFTNPSNLKLHSMIHTRVKMFGCNVCGRRFTQASGLKQHRRIHTGEWLYICKACGKGFMNNSDFKRHQMGHLPLESGGQSGKDVAKI